MTTPEPAGFAHRQPFKLLNRLEVGVGCQVDLYEGAFGLTDRGQKIVGRQGLADLHGADVEGGQAVRFQPDAHGKQTTAENPRFTHAFDRVQHWLNRAHRIVSSLLD